MHQESDYSTRIFSLAADKPAGEWFGGFNVEIDEPVGPLFGEICHVFGRRQKPHAHAITL